MRVADVTDLSIVTVLDRGVPNKECIAIQANNAVNLGQYGIMLGTFAGDKSAVPFIDHLYWFGDGFIEGKDWLFLYTGTGDNSKRRGIEDKFNVFSLYWGKPATVFAQSFVVPILFRADAVDVPSPPENLPQIGSSSG